MKIKRNCLVCGTETRNPKFCTLKCAYRGRNSCHPQNGWTPEEIEKLKTLYSLPSLKGELKLNEFAKTINRLPSNVCRKARQLKLGTTHCRKQSEKLNRELGERARKQLVNVPVHLRKFTFWGGKHTKKMKGKMSDRVKREWKNPNSKFNSLDFRDGQALRMSTLQRNRSIVNGYSVAVKGKREDLDNRFFRSNWEANIARVFNFLKYKWEYEPKRFDFIDKGERRGVLSYLPDFKVYDDKSNPKNYHWYEIKGWLKSKDKSSFKKFRKYYPDEFSKLKIVIQKSFSRRGRMSKPYFELLNQLKIPKKQIEFYNQYRDGFRGLIKDWEGKQ